MKNILYTLILFSLSASAQWKPHAGRYQFDSLKVTNGSGLSDTASVKPFGIKADGTLVPFSYWPAGGGSSYTTGTSGTDFNISGSVINLPSASTTARGAVTTAAQTFGGVKSFNTGIQIPGALTSPGGSGSLELEYNSSIGYISSYNRGGSTWMPLYLRGLTVRAIISGTEKMQVNSSGIMIPASSYLNMGTTAGTSGYGIFDNAGVMQRKNSGGSWENIASTSSLIAEGVTVTSNTSYSVVATDLNIIYEGASGATITLPTITNGRVLYISNATGNTLNVSANLYIDGTNNTLSIAPNTTVKIVGRTSDSRWYRIFQN